MATKALERKFAMRIDGLGYPTGDYIPMDEIIQAACGEDQRTLQVSGLQLEVAVTPTVTAASAYTAGDSIGGKLTLASAVAVAAGASILGDIMLLDRANQKPQGTILIFNADPAAATLTDKTAFVFSTDDLKVVAAIPVVTADWTTINSKAVANLTMTKQVKAASGTTLYAAFVTTSTPTFAAASDFKAIFKFRPVNA